VLAFAVAVRCVRRSASAAARHRICAIRGVLRKELPFYLGAVLEANDPRDFGEFMAPMIEAGCFGVDEHETRRCGDTDSSGEDMGLQCDLARSVCGGRYRLVLQRVAAVWWAGILANEHVFG
jgi:hypothetical protein